VLREGAGESYLNAGNQTEPEDLGGERKVVEKKGGN